MLLLELTQEASGGGGQWQRRGRQLKWLVEEMAVVNLAVAVGLWPQAVVAVQWLGPPQEPREEEVALAGKEATPDQGPCG
ncbi:UNVERIFIED_CONTAM: hypothetical protein K2H54_073355 [Gekko kuhli]